MAKRLVERVTFEHLRVGGTDAAPVVEGVLLCGPVSANRRRYLKKAFEGDRVKRYNDAPVFADHDDGVRSYKVQIGTIQNARHRADGMPIGDIAVNPEKELGRAFVWDARHKPKACGMSHVAHCETTRANDGWDDVTELVKVESVDVISAGNAATTHALNESSRRRTVANFSLKKFVERFGAKWGAARWHAATKLCEDMGAAADAPIMDEPPAEQTDGDLKTALMSALAPILDEAFETGNSDKACSALRDFIKMHAKHTGKDAGKEPPEEPAEESKRPTAAVVLAECKAKSFAASAEDLVILTAIADPVARATYIESHTKNPGNRPAGTSRRPGAGTAGNQPPTKESTAAPAKPAALPKWDDI